ncbi:sortase domain-containing protein [Bacillus sp. AK031]
MKKRLLVLVIFLLAAGIAGYQVLAQDEPKTTMPQQKELQTEEQETEVEEVEEVKAEPGGEEFVLLGSLKKKKAEQEKKIEIQEEGIIPARIKIPSLDIDTEVIPVGLLENGEMEVPKGTEVAGWYNRGIKAGAKGNAVVAGHVDSKEGPAIFFYLKNMEIGEKVTVTDTEGIEQTFVVKQKESYQAEEAPIEKIFGPDNSRNLNLITCTGTFNYEEHLYPDRLVIYTELIDENNNEQTLPPPEPPTNVEYDLGSVSWHAVQDENIIGYRVYKKGPGEKEFNHIASISAHERKNYYDENAEKGTAYYITAVNIAEKESPPSEIVKAR